MCEFMVADVAEARSEAPEGSRLLEGAPQSGVLQSVHIQCFEDLSAGCLVTTEHI